MSRAAADIAIFCVCAGAFLFYHIALLVFRFDPASVYHHSSLVNVHSQARSSRRFWVEKIAEREAEAIIGIQTLR